ncbi:MAG: DUF5110 domain-containing protein [Bacteroidetes bacterium]|nr:DUF5110 domain-containing protein [Bacteroidota bacterium]
MLSIRICLTLALAILISTLVSQPYNPMANPKALVVSGNSRFTILTDHVIRLEFSTDSSFTNQASLTFVNRNLPVPEFTSSETNGWLMIKTKYCSLHYQQNSGAFNAHNLFIEYSDGQHSFTWKPGIRDHKNLKGTTRTLDGCSGKFSFYGLKKIPLEDGLLSRSGWTLIDDSERPLFDNTDWPWVQNRIGDIQDFYFFSYGNNYKAALYDFTLVAGKISLPPKFAFGIWYSRYWNYTENELKEIANEYERNNIPLDVLVVDMDWHLTEQSSPEIFNRYTPKPNGWTGFTWEKKYFPDYKEFLSWTNNKNLQTCLNLHPAAGVQQHEAAYSAFASAMNFDTTNHAAIPFDVTNKKFAQTYLDVLLHPYEKDGIDFWWLDWQQWGHTNIKGVNPTFYLNYVHFSDMQRERKRPLIFHRWGGLGNHRYQIGFSGDYFINWKSLAYQPAFTANAANVGFGYWSHDIGGHMAGGIKNEHDPELFTRWVQWGAFSPIFRTHATKNGEIERRIYKYPQANFNAMRKALQQRYTLLPYIYTMARFVYDSAVSLVRPMYYEFPEMEKAYHLEHQYFFGNNMIVAPVTKSMDGKETVSQTVWLPEGNWFDYRNNNLLQGGKEITANYALDEIPVFVKAGSIIPTQTAKLRIEGSILDTLILTVYPAETAIFNLYEDEGGNEDYRKDICSFTKFTWQKNKGTDVLKIEPDGKTFPNQVKERSYEIRIVSSERPTDVKRNGKSMDWNYDEKNQVLTIKTLKELIANTEIEIR